MEFKRRHQETSPPASAPVSLFFPAGDRRSLRLRADDPRCRHLSADLIVTDLEQLIDYIS